MTAGLMPDVLRNHLTRRANQEHDTIIGLRAKPIEAGAISRHQRLSRRLAGAHAGRRR
jgi:hypothetical protein